MHKVKVRQVHNNRAALEADLVDRTVLCKLLLTATLDGHTSWNASASSPHSSRTCRPVDASSSATASGGCCAPAARARSTASAASGLPRAASASTILNGVSAVAAPENREVGQSLACELSS